MEKYHSVRGETCCRHMGYFFRLTARVLLYAPFDRQDSTYHIFFTPVVEHWLEREISTLYSLLTVVIYTSLLQIDHTGG